MEQGYDAIIVGARCAGSATAIGLARAGASVLLIDKATFPSDTISTHYIFPNTLEVLDDLGVMDTLRARHELSFTDWYWRGFGQTWGGRFSSFGGYDKASGIRRIALDAAMLDTAIAAGATAELGRSVASLIGSGTPDDPVTGVVLDDGERATAPIVIGADGRRSFVARTLGIADERAQQGGIGFLFRYYRGLSMTDAVLEVRPDEMMLVTPNEDGICNLILSGPPSITSGSADEREERYEAGLRRFGDIIDQRALETAEPVTELRVAPETMMRGFFRRPAGPGWALVGDAGHFKHPSTAQGIGDAVAQARYVAAALDGADPTLEKYGAWRDERSGEHYDLSFRFAQMPDDVLAPKYFAGIANDPQASREFCDQFTRLIEPSAFDTPERMAAWLA